jgi:hypothetical protein
MLAKNGNWEKKLSETIAKQIIRTTISQNKPEFERDEPERVSNRHLFCLLFYWIIIALDPCLKFEAWEPEIYYTKNKGIFIAIAISWRVCIRIMEVNQARLGAIKLCCSSVNPSEIVLELLAYALQEPCTFELLRERLVRWFSEQYS